MFVIVFIGFRFFCCLFVGILLFLCGFMVLCDCCVYLILFCDLLGYIGDCFINFNRFCLWYGKCELYSYIIEWYLFFF